MTEPDMSFYVKLYYLGYKFKTLVKMVCKNTGDTPEAASMALILAIGAEGTKPLF